MEPETAEAVPRSPVSVEVRARGLQLIQDKPPASGGGDAGMMASELLLSALLGCQHSTFVKVAAKRRVDVAVERIHGEVRFDDAGDIREIEVRYRLTAPVAVLDQQLMQVCRLTDRACTISRALKVPVQWSYERVTAGAPAASANAR